MATRKSTKKIATKPFDDEAEEEGYTRLAVAAWNTGQYPDESGKQRVIIMQVPANTKLEDVVWPSPDDATRKAEAQRYVNGEIDWDTLIERTEDLGSDDGPNETAWLPATAAGLVGTYELPEAHPAD